MFTGALVGALLLVSIDLVLPLSVAAVVIAAAALAAHWLSTKGSDWDQLAGTADGSPSHTVRATAPGS
jgi:hypothetical protein